MCQLYSSNVIGCHETSIKLTIKYRRQQTVPCINVHTHKSKVQNAFYLIFIHNSLHSICLLCSLEFNRTIQISFIIYYASIHMPFFPLLSTFFLSFFRLHGILCVAQSTQNAQHACSFTSLRSALSIQRELTLLGVNKSREGKRLYLGRDKEWVKKRERTKCSSKLTINLNCFRQVQFNQ